MSHFRLIFKKRQFFIKKIFSKKLCVLKIEQLTFENENDDPYFGFI